MFQHGTALSNIRYTPSPAGAGSINDILDNGGSAEKLNFGEPKFSFDGTLKWVHILSIAIVLFGALNCLSIGLFRFDFITRPLGKRGARWIFGLIGIAALTIVFHRDTYLPFLGESVFPCNLLVDKTPPGAAKSVTVTVEPGAKVLYWAAEPDTEHLEHLNDWRKAYLKFENAGVTTANQEGVAVLKVREPQAYTVMGGRRVGPHIHYRICGDKWPGMMNRVQTIYLD